MKYSLIIPCFNESKNLPLLLERCEELLRKQNIEVVLVDNGSTDNTKEVLSQLLPKYPDCRVVYVEINKGYGYGIISGLNEAIGDILGWTHADMQTDPKDIFSAIEIFKEYGVNTFVKGKRYGRPFFDIVFTVGMSVFESILLGSRMWDINAQPTMFSRKFYETWSSPPDDFSLDLYAYYQAVTQKLCIYRFPVKFGERAHGSSHWNINWVAKWKFIRRTVEFSIQLKRNLNR